jgi:pyruvate ferredoxin oxidoreductase beta subunit
MATACSAYPQDLFKKVRKALSIRGPTFIHILAPCPPGWRYSSEKTVEMGKLAVKTGIWVLYEREYDTLSISAASKAARKKPLALEEYLKPQGRFKGLGEKALTDLRQSMERNWRKLEQEVAGPC